VFDANLFYWWYKCGEFLVDFDLDVSSLARHFNTQGDGNQSDEDIEELHTNQAAGNYVIAAVQEEEAGEAANIGARDSLARRNGRHIESFT
jgi:hypothetical protein